MRRTPAQRDELLAILGRMPSWLDEMFSGLGDAQARAPGRDGAFSPVEQVWHLADLEREGFALRIEKLMRGSGAFLPDFDGAAIAAARDYRSLSLADGLAAFTAARSANLAALCAVTSAETWAHSGTQEGVGPVSLCDLPSFMSQHDTSHRAEIEDWMRHVRGASSRDVGAASGRDPTQ